jgi:hypothetical protein
MGRSALHVCVLYMFLTGLIMSQSDFQVALRVRNDIPITTFYARWSALLMPPLILSLFFRPLTAFYLEPYLSSEMNHYLWKCVKPSCRALSPLNVSVIAWSLVALFSLSRIFLVREAWETSMSLNLLFSNWELLQFVQTQHFACAVLAESLLNSDSERALPLLQLRVIFSSISLHFLNEMIGYWQLSDTIRYSLELAIECLAQPLVLLMLFGLRSYLAAPALVAVLVITYLIELVHSLRTSSPTSQIIFNTFQSSDWIG